MAHPSRPNRRSNDQYEIRLPNRDVEYVPGHWYPQEVDLWEKLIRENPELTGDTMAQMLFDMSLFEYRDLDGNDRNRMAMVFEQYLDETYSIDLKDAVDWDTYREWYGIGA